MQELLKNAWMGWQAYNANGKFAALLLMLLVLYWIFWGEEKERRLWIYTSIAVICCVFPVSAALLMTYQTKFYDYQWIWNYVPMTIMIAYGGVLFLTKQWEGFGVEQAEKYIKGLKKAGMTLAVVALILLCGRLGQPVFDAQTERQQRENVRDVITAIAESGEQICLWAPQEVMEAVRAQQPDIRLVYGRDLWDASLGAYTYETYGETEEILHVWMETVGYYHDFDIITAEGMLLEGAKCVEMALEAGVNRILLPTNTQPEEVLAMEQFLGIAHEKLGDYYLFIL